MKKTYLRITLVLMVAILFALPLVQMQYHLLPKLKLFGVETAASPPVLSFSAVKTGEYQKQFEIWFDQNFGLREYFVKTDNQIFYSVFRETPPQSSISVGRKGYLYENDYINEYLNFIPPRTPADLEYEVKEMQALQQALNNRGVTFLLLISPSKASIYPEYIPQRMKAMQTNHLRNYDMLIPLLDKYQINYVDGHQITQDNKETSGFEMFPQGGTHWNYLAAYYSAKQAVDRMEQLTARDMIDLELAAINVDEVPTGSDRDLAELLNLWHPPVSYTAVHPQITTNPQGNEHRPSILIEGGSFSNHLIDIIGTNQVFSTLDYYFYYNYHNFYQDNSIPQGIGYLNRVDWENEVFAHDIIIVEMNEQTINQFSKGFIHDALAHAGSSVIDFSELNEEYVQKNYIDGVPGFLIAKGADASGTVYMESGLMKLEPNKEYTISYRARGFQRLNCDLFPDSLPQFDNNEVTDEDTEYTFTFKSGSDDMTHARIRFFIDGLQGTTDKDTYIYDVELTAQNNVVTAH